MCRPSPTHPARQAHGGITWVTALLLALLAAGVYMGWTWLPVWVVHASVRQVVREYMNRAVNEPDDDQLVEDMIHKLRVLDQVGIPDESGKLVATPTVQVARADVTWERNTGVDPPMLHVAFSYSRPVEYPLLNRWTRTTLSVDITGDLARPDWGPMR